MTPAEVRAHFDELTPEDWATLQALRDRFGAKLRAVEQPGKQIGVPPPWWQEECNEND